MTLRLAIAGLGAIGMKLAQAIDRGAVPGVRLTAVSARDRTRAQARLAGFADPPAVVTLAELAGRAVRAAILRRANMGDGARIALEGAALAITEGVATARLELGDLPEGAGGYVLSAQETYDPPTTALDANGQGVPYAVYGYGAQIAEVEVDTRLGTVRVRRMVAAHDLGRVVNPVLAEGQIEGGIAQGLGMALMEEYLPGRTENLHDYLIPTFGDMPEITSILIEVPDPEGPFGVKGLGEHVLIPTAPAILNAIRHASGARLRQLPALPHRVLAAIDAANDDAGAR